MQCHLLSPVALCLRYGALGLGLSVNPGSKVGPGPRGGPGIDLFGLAKVNVYRNPYPPELEFQHSVLPVSINFINCFIPW